MEDWPGKVIADKYGNKIKLCEKCNVPVFVKGAMITCMNGCYLGEIDWRPRNIKATEENDYNPVVAKMCQECNLEGYYYCKEDGEWCKKICKSCDGAGYIEEKKYGNNNTVLQLEVEDDLWSRCPNCNFRFKISDLNVWLGNRHQRCGQKLTVPNQYSEHRPEKANK